MFYLSNGTGAYVWDCDHWTFLDFTGVTQSDWAAKENEAGYIKNKPFKVLGNGLSVDENGVLSVTVDSLVTSVNGQTGDVEIDGTKIVVSPDDSRSVAEAIKESGGGTATEADKLSTARDLKVDLTSKLAQSFDGSEDATTIGVTGTLPLANGGTGNNKGEAIPKTTNPNTSLTNGTINTNAKNAVLKYRILNDVIYISGSIDVVASDSNGESIKVGNIPEQYQPKSLINGVGKVHLNVGLFSKGFENAQVVVVGDENTAAKGAVMFSVQSTAKLTAGTWTFFGSYNLI